MAPLQLMNSENITLFYFLNYIAQAKTNIYRRLYLFYLLKLWSNYHSKCINNLWNHIFVEYLTDDLLNLIDLLMSRIWLFSKSFCKLDIHSHISIYSTNLMFILLDRREIELADWVGSFKNIKIVQNAGLDH